MKWVRPFVYELWANFIATKHWLEIPPQMAVVGSGNAPPKKNRVRNYTWRIIPISKWLIIMVSKSPNWRCSTSKWPRWLIIGGDPNHLRSSWDPILQVVICLDELVWKQLNQKFTAEEIGKNECQTTLWLGERSTPLFHLDFAEELELSRKARPHEKCRFLSS